MRPQTPDRQACSRIRSNAAKGRTMDFLDDARATFAHPGMVTWSWPPFTPEPCCDRFGPDGPSPRGMTIRMSGGRESLRFTERTR